MIVVDTHVVSELMRPSPSPTVITWVRSYSERELYTTSITLAEIRYGIGRLPDGRRKNVLSTTAEEVFVTFAEHILPFDAVAAGHYATIVCAREDAGRPIDGFDAQIAAITRTHRATLATRNLKHFNDTGINVINPWASQP